MQKTHRATLLTLALALGACSDPVAVTQATDSGADRGAPDVALDALTPTDAQEMDAARADVPAALDAAPPTIAVSHAVHVIVEPGDHAAALVAAIRAARTSVHVTMYLLSSREVIAALSDAHARGLEVQVVLNRTIPGGATPNTASFDGLAAAGIAVHYANPRYTYTHEKCVILDGVEAWIMTMNATITAPENNREFLAVDREPDDVRDAEAIFRADFGGAAYPTYTGRLVVAPLNAQRQLAALIGTATRTIDIESEELEDRTTASALIARMQHGVTVRAVTTDLPPTASATRTIANLVAAGAHIVTLHSPYMHAKTIVIDGARAYVGSANLGYTSLTANRELGVLFDTPAEVARVASTIATDFSTGTPY